MEALAMLCGNCVFGSQQIQFIHNMARPKVARKTRRKRFAHAPYVCLIQTSLATLARLATIGWRSMPNYRDRAIQSLLSHSVYVCLSPLEPSSASHSPFNCVICFAFFFLCFVAFKIFRIFFACDLFAQTESEIWLDCSLWLESDWWLRQGKPEKTYKILLQRSCWQVWIKVNAMEICLVFYDPFTKAMPLSPEPSQSCLQDCRKVFPCMTWHFVVWLSHQRLFRLRPQTC